MAFDGFDLILQWRQFQILDQFPNQPRFVAGRDQIVDHFPVGVDLRAVRRSSEATLPPHPC
jgi:hypothetical protein